MGRKRYKLNFWDDGRVCNKCKQFWPLECFHKNRTKFLGVESTCKTCVSLRKKIIRMSQDRSSVRD